MWFSFGSLDFARGSSGIEVISKKFGELDLYGKPKFGGVDHIAHEIACASALLIGQTNEGIPAVIVRGYKYNKSEEKLSDYQLRPETIIMIIREIIKSSIKVLGLKSMLKLFIKLFKP
jgi:coenzyme F420-0:L-glutamate ligase/coenzyme F420-1:gamma-L-glutamate ligase